MQLNMLKSKLHRATITFCDLDYEGSIAIDQDLLDAAGILAFEQVEIYNITNGERLTTYAIPAERGTKTIGLNGAAARKAVKGDEIIICTYCVVPSEQARNYKADVVMLDKQNNVKSTH